MFDLTPTRFWKSFEEEKRAEHQLEICKRDAVWINDIEKFYKHCKVHSCKGIVDFVPYKSEAELLKKFATKRMNSRKTFESCSCRSKTVWQNYNFSDLCIMANNASTEYYCVSLCA